LVAVAAVGVVVAVLVRRDSSPARPAAAAGSAGLVLPSTTTTPPSPEHQQILELLMAGRRARSHATYAGTSSGSPVTLDVQRDGGRMRQELTSEKGAFRAIEIYYQGQTTTCQQAPGAELRCSSAPATADDADGLIGSSLDSLGDDHIIASDDTIDGRAVRCFTFGADGKAGSACFTPAGLPVRIVTPDGDLHLTGLDDTVDGEAFTPPAAVTP
jgi:hypothetical protein